MATTAVVTTGVLTALPAAALAAPNSTFVACNDVTGPNGLIAAINAANAAGSGTIKLADNCAYFLTGATGLPTITGNITLRAKNATIRRFSATAFRIVQINGGGRLRADGITFAGGDAGGGVGGGILVNAGATLQLSDGRVTQNNGLSGGGIGSLGGTVRLFNTIVNNNTANTGAGISSTGTASLAVVGGLIGFNTGGAGAGVTVSGGTASLTSTDIVHNTAVGAVGGGMQILSGNVTLRSSRVQFNTAATSGGGIENTGTLQILNSRLSDNQAAVTAGNTGGALRNSAGGTTTIRNSVLTRNAANDGGAISEAGGSVVVFRSLITNNHPNNCAPPGSVPGCSG